MTNATGKTSKATKPATVPFEAFSAATPSLEVPAAFREFAEKSVSQARDAYARLKSVSEEATGLAEATFENAREGGLAIGVKAIEAARSNSDASFALARDLFGAKTMSEVVELQSAFVRRQFEAMSAQMKEFQALGEKVVAETTKPVSDRIQRTFKELNAA